MGCDADPGEDTEGDRAVVCCAAVLRRRSTRNPKAASAGVTPKREFAGSNFPLRGEKLQVSLGRIRADDILSWPGYARLGIRPGTNRNLFHTVDWLPTLVDLTRKRSQTTRMGVAGVSQKRSLLGGRPVRDRACWGTI